jgi:hypothetical protein
MAPSAAAGIAARRPRYNQETKVRRGKVLMGMIAFFRKCAEEDTSIAWLRAHALFFDLVRGSVRCFFKITIASLIGAALA